MVVFEIYKSGNPRLSLCLGVVSVSSIMTSLSIHPPVQGKVFEIIFVSIVWVLLMFRNGRKVRVMLIEL